ncbi:MAG: VOC family protein [Pseudobdellovibrio sp.]
MLKKFSHPMIYVNDLGRAVTWYKNILGFKENFVAPNVYASLRHEGMNFQLDLHPTEANSKDVGFGSIQYFVPDNFDKMIEELKSKNVKVGTPKREGDSPRFVTFWDSEGNALGLIEQ